MILLRIVRPECRWTASGDGNRMSVGGNGRHGREHQRRRMIRRFRCPSWMPKAGRLCRRLGLAVGLNLRRAGDDAANARRLKVNSISHWPLLRALIVSCRTIPSSQARTEACTAYPISQRVRRTLLVPDELWPPPRMLVQARQSTVHKFRAPQSSLNRRPLLQGAWSQYSSPLQALRLFRCLVGVFGLSRFLAAALLTFCHCYSPSSGGAVVSAWPSSDRASSRSMSSRRLAMSVFRRGSWASEVVAKRESK